MNLSARLVAASLWLLIGLFALLAVAHVVLTVLFYVGVNDQGYGFFLDFEWPGWLITLLDALVVALVWRIRVSADSPAVSFAAALVVAVIVIGRTLWMVFAPVAAGVVVLDTARRWRRPREGMAETR